MRGEASVQRRTRWRCKWRGNGAALHSSDSRSVWNIYQQSVTLQLHCSNIPPDFFFLSQCFVVIFSLSLSPPHFSSKIRQWMMTQSEIPISAAALLLLLFSPAMWRENGVMNLIIWYFSFLFLCPMLFFLAWTASVAASAAAVAAVTNIEFNSVKWPPAALTIPGAAAELWKQQLPFPP